MKADRLRLNETTDYAAWDAWVELSPQGTVFSKVGFLRSLGAPFRLFVVDDGAATVALVPLIEDAVGNAVRFPFTPYQGVLLIPSRQAQQRQRIVDEFRITEFVVGALTQRYRSLAMALSWNFNDLRAFLWHNHDVAGAPRIVSQPRYTAVLDLAAVDPAGYASELRACRRQEIRKASGYVVEEASGLDEFLMLYAQTFARQDIPLASDRLELVRKICESALAGGYGRLTGCRTPEGIAAMTLFLHDSKRAYYLFAANNPSLRHTGASTRLMFENILDAKRRGLRELDFVGVNSPARGDFKLSFNPELKLYFELDYPAAGTGAAAS